MKGTMMPKTPDEELEFIYNFLYNKYKKHEIYRKEYCDIMGISDRTLKRRIDAGKNIVAFKFDADTGKYSWKLLDIAKYLVGRNFKYHQNNDATILTVTP